MECHDEDRAESDLVLSSRAGMLAGGNFGPALNPGEPSQSLLISAIRHDEFTKRPPKEELSTNDVINLTRWVEMGARCQALMFITAVRFSAASNIHRRQTGPITPNSPTGLVCHVFPP